MYESGKTTTFWCYLLLAGQRRTSGKRVQGCTQDVAHAVSMQPARAARPRSFPSPLFPGVSGRGILRSSAGIEYSEIGLSKEEEEFDVRVYRCRGSHRGGRNRAL